MGLLAKFRWNRAARHYARALPGWLARSYGASNHYTVPQIDAAIAALKLPRQFIALGYAVYLTADDYEAKRAKYPLYLDYDAARELFLSALPRKAISPSAATDHSSLAGYSYDDHGGHHGGHH